MNYKENETVNITLERYEDLKEYKERFYELLGMISQSKSISKDRLFIDKYILKDIYIKAYRNLNVLSLGTPYDDIELENIKFNEVE